MDFHLVRDLQKEIKSCSCQFRTRSRPQVFQLFPAKKVMLITQIPTFQFTYKSLTSTRFFRTLCLALFGNDLKNDNIINTFLSQIYWTHYHKCYYDRVFQDPSFVLPPYCSNKFIKKELSIVSPSFVIILGLTVLKSLLKSTFIQGEYFIDRFQGIPCLCADFPKVGNESEFEDIRKQLAKYIKGVNTKPVPESYASKNTHIKGKIAVHADFEIRCLERYFEKLLISNNSTIDNLSNDLDELWYKKEVLPQWERYSFVMLCVSFLEDQITPLLSEMGYKENPSKKICEEIKDLIAYYGKSELIIANKDLFDDIESLKKLRNDIVHNGGRVRSYNNIRKRIIGVEEYFGMIRITEEGCKAIFAIVKRVVELLTDIENSCSVKKSMPIKEKF